MFTTHLGPGAATDVAVDPDGNIYVVGWTSNTSFPTTPGAYQTTLDPGWYAAFVVKLAPDGTVVYSTLLSGPALPVSGRPAGTLPNGVAVDGSGHAVVVGTTAKMDFPTTEGAAVRSTAESVSGFVTELTSDGSGLVYSTLLGSAEPNPGSVEGYSIAYGVALDAAGTAYATGVTLSLGFPTSPGAPGPYCNPAAGNASGFLTRIGSDGGLVSSTNLVDQTSSVAVQPDGQTVLGGAAGGFARYCAPATIDQIDANGISSIDRWTFPPCGPDGSSAGVKSVATDSSGDVYVAGWQYPPDAQHPIHPFLQRLGPTLDLVSTFTVPDGATPTDVAVDATGVWLAFTADGPLYPTAGGGVSPPSSDQAGAYLVRLGSSDGAPGFSTYVADTSGLAVASDAGRAVVAGMEMSGPFAGQAFVTVYEPVPSP